MNIPRESTFISLQNETKFNVIDQKIMQQSPTEKLFIRALPKINGIGSAR